MSVQFPLTNILLKQALVSGHQPLSSLAGYYVRGQLLRKGTGLDGPDWSGWKNTPCGRVRPSRAAAGGELGVH